jgi:hypothetical protein
MLQYFLLLKIDFEGKSRLLESNFPRNKIEYISHLYCLYFAAFFSKQIKIMTSSNDQNGIQIQKYTLSDERQFYKER